MDTSRRQKGTTDKGLAVRG